MQTLLSQAIQQVFSDFAILGTGTISDAAILFKRAEKNTIRIV